jgi:methylmalonyl-CoA mutase C-terminal domain/subunit
VALSILSGAHMTLFPRVLELMREKGIGDVLLTGGGIIPKEDMVALRQMGVGDLFGPGTTTAAIIDYIRGATRGDTPAAGATGARPARSGPAKAGSAR